MNLRTDLILPIINYSTQIENFLGEIISYHYCKSMASIEYFFKTIVNESGFGFHFKIKFFGVLTLDYPEIFGQYHDIQKRLNDFKEFRNKIVHRNNDTMHVYTSGDAEPKLVLKRSILDKNPYEITESEIEDKKKLMSQLLTDLIFIRYEFQKIYSAI